MENNVAIGSALILIVLRKIALQ